jgi:hypothetical protein
MVHGVAPTLKHILSSQVTPCRDVLYNAHFWLPHHSIATRRPDRLCLTEFNLLEDVGVFADLHGESHLMEPAR